MYIYIYIYTYVFMYVLNWIIGCIFIYNKCKFNLDLH